MRGRSRRPGALRAARIELENAILAERVTFKGEEIPLRTAQARLAVLPEYRDREELGDIYSEASAGFNEGRRELMGAENELAADLSGTVDPVARNEEEKGISIRTLAERLAHRERRER